MSDEGARRRGGQPVRLGDVLGRALERVGPKALWTDAKMRKLWPEIVGPEVAAHARILRLRGTDLVIEVSSDSWSTELRYLSRVVIDKLNERVGEGTVTQIVVVKSRGRAQL